MDQEQIDQFNQKQKDATEKQRLLDAVSQSALDISKTIVAAENHTKDVNITNDLAKPSDIEKVVQAVNAIDLKPQDLQPIASALDQVSQAIAKLPTEYPEFPGFPEAPEQREDVKVTNLSELKEYFSEVVTAVGKLQTSIKFDPKIEVKPADVTVNEKEVDLTPVTKGLANLEKAFKNIKAPAFDTTDITSGLKAVKDTINNLTFPSPNYVLPFKGEEGEGVQVQLVGGAVPITGTIQTTAPEGGASESEQEDQTQVLNQILSAISAVASARGIASDLRVTLLGGTTAVTGTLTAVTTVTTVTTVAGLTNIGGLPATQLIPSNQNTVAVLSNINNIV